MINHEKQYQAHCPFNFLSFELFLNYEFVLGNYLILALKPKVLIEKNTYKPNYTLMRKTLEKNFRKEPVNFKCVFYLDFFRVKQKLFPTSKS